MNKVLPFVSRPVQRPPDFDGRRGRVFCLALHQDRWSQGLFVQMMALPRAYREAPVAAPPTKPARPAEPALPPAPSEPAPAPRPRVNPKVVLLPPTAPHPLQRVARVLWRYMRTARHLDVAFVAYQALVGLIAAPFLFAGGYVLGGMAMAGVGGFFCWFVVERVRALRPKPEPEVDDSEWAALHYRVRR